MTRLFTINIFLACVFLLATSFALAAEDILRLVPESALGFLIINKPMATDAKIQELGHELKISLPSLKDILKQKYNIQQGLDENGTIALIIFPPEKEGATPILIFLLPVTNYDLFIQQFKQEDAGAPITKISFLNISAWARNIGGYVALSDAPHRQLLENSLNLSNEVPAFLDTWKDCLKSNDIVGIIFQTGIKQLPGGIPAVNSFLQDIDNRASTTVNDPDLFKKSIEIVAKEVSACGFGLQFDKKDALRINTRTITVPGSKLSQLIAQTPPANKNLLKGLPNKPFASVAIGPVSEIWDWGGMEVLQKLKDRRERYGLSREDADKIPEMPAKILKNAQAASTVWGVGQNDESWFSNVLIVTQVRDSHAFLTDYEEYLQQYVESTKNISNIMLPSVEFQKSKLNAAQALKYKIDFSGLSNMNDVLSSIIKSFYGPDKKMEVWLVAVNEHTIVTGYNNQEMLWETVEAIKQGMPLLANDASLSKANTLFPPDSSFIVYLNPHGITEMFKRMLLNNFPSIEKRKESIPEFSKTPLLGFAVTTTSDEFQTFLAIPAEVIQSIGPYKEKIIALLHEITSDKP